MDESNTSLLALVAQIISAHGTNNTVTADNLPKLINDVHRALAGAGQAAAAPLRGEPAVPVKKSALADHLVCLECGKHFSMLKRHLATDHQFTPEQYRQKWDLPFSYPMIAPNYAKVRSAVAKKIGLGRKTTGRKKAVR